MDHGGKKAIAAAFFAKPDIRRPVAP